MRLTLVHPCIGRRVGQRYIRSWQMEPLQPAALAALTPSEVDLRFYDDRMESIPYDEPTDLVAISVETYTARRAYQIASEYRRRGVPVVMGGFHATLCPAEVAQYADCLVEGEADTLWPELIDDARRGALKPHYRSEQRPNLRGVHYDRHIFQGKRYLPIGLIEAGRGCRFRCDFCAVQSFFGASYRMRPVDDIIEELRENGRGSKLLFFVDDNFAADLDAAKELLRAMQPLGLRWVTQLSINAAHDEEFLALLAHSGCAGVLIGFETLDPEGLKAMRKGFNTMGGGYETALENLRRYRLRVYATFVFGYDHDTGESFERALDFALDQRFYIAAFNHLTPFPGTPLYRRLEDEERLLYEHWWLDDNYSYNRLPFRPARLSAEEVQARCVDARSRFYSWSSMLRRGFDAVNRADWFMFRNFFPINLMHRAEVDRRNHYPLGDAAWQGTLLKV